MPVNKVVRVQVTGADVIHSFIVQSLGVRMDAVPGRLNETWFKAEREGIYYGECSKLCGKDHSFMPIAIRVVSQDKYEAWLQDAKKKFASTSDGRVNVAATSLQRTSNRPRDLRGSGLRPCRTQPPSTRPTTAIRTAGGATCIRRTTRTSAPST